ncbi:uncharacterized protein LOC141637277 [Silene latifolia]|uniref:uncharacterized protein LOC141637277 n=1 Tax=Silene latifolia TaxID=37657 RepID=UPI003D78B08A
MGKKVAILTTILVCFTISHVTNAEFLFNFRRLASSSANKDSNVTVPSIQTPPSVPVENNQISPPSVPVERNPKEDQLKKIRPLAKPPIDTNNHDNSPVEEVKEDSIDTSKDKEKEDDKNPKEEVKEKEKVEKRPSESCDGKERICHDDKSMVACVKSIDYVSKAVVLLIQNNGENNLKVHLSFSSSGNEQQPTEITKLQTEQVNISLAKVGGNEIKLNAGNGYCVLHLDVGAPTFQGNYFKWVQSYSRFMTPMYGAYLMLSVTLVAVGVCACCWFSKRTRTNEVRYQELEMSMPESAADGDTADGWDEVWDDDWDEEKAVKSPGHSVSANGLTSRTLKRDGWEEWDD